ncbi:MAG: metal-sensing transcriptional repressor [Erysipelotrichaceae bacterium]|nr:metal-sensing transcriptional repressor [Erysipelotrichaceae bacterium]MBR2545137.1 metal-sensing transcriptional repressor [Erysipelotrichaceae bacterium]MBR2701291.1 metal-sensing transcriptional repressor [Erysipelotrichaceae bacterium]MBR2745514.1 metal-sensing transcriptional repressor [Erysipelotrichaceae bacterium]
MDNCCTKHKQRSPEEIKALTNRLNRIEGQIKGIRKMIEEDRYCVDIITQVSSVQAAVNAFTKELLNSHIRSCVVDDIKAGNDEAVNELCNLLQKTMK